MKRVDFLDCSLDAYILRGSRAARHKLLYAVVDALIPEVVKSARDLRCPYCGKRFRSRWGLARHLRAAGKACRAAYRRDKQWVIEEYLRLKENLVEVWPGGGRGRCLKFRGADQPRFASLDELCDWVRANGLLVSAGK